MLRIIFPILLMKHIVAIVDKFGISIMFSALFDGSTGWFAALSEDSFSLLVCFWCVYFGELIKVSDRVIIS